MVRQNRNFKFQISEFQISNYSVFSQPITYNL